MYYCLRGLESDSMSYYYNKHVHLLIAAICLEGWKTGYSCWESSGKDIICRVLLCSVRHSSAYSVQLLPGGW